MGRTGKRVGAVSVSLVVALVAASFAGAELSQKGDLFVRFDGGISPKALPREALAPIAVRIEGTVRVPKRHEPPSIRRIRIALNRAGRLDTKGLPICRRGQIRAVSAARALAVCGDAFVGSGGIVANTRLSGQPHIPLRGTVTLFNGRDRGRPAILAQIFQTTPLPITNVVTFDVHHARGTFGTVIAAEMPPALQHNSYLKSIFLRLQRAYVFHGKRHAYLSAGCDAPRGFSKAVFPFAKASMSFDDGKVLSSTLIRTCRASG